MKNRTALTFLCALCLCLCCYYLASCSKSSHAALEATPTTAVSLSVNDSTIIYPLDLAYIQDVDSIHTTLISAQFPDTSVKQGSLGIRLLGDTTGRFQGSKLLATYTDGNGNVYYNNSDSTNYVQIDKFPKTYNGVVSGSFAMTVTGSAGSIHLTNGSIIAIYQQ
jgi:hypothetical protein